jgi:Flp pilus assembly protein TadG
MRTARRSNIVGTRAKYGKRRGSATLEFALVLPILLYLILGIIEFGWMIKSQLTIANATREGARFAALGNTSTAVRTRVKTVSTSLPTSLTDGQIVLDQTADRTSTSPTYSAWPSDTSDTPPKNGVVVGNLLRVTVNYPFKPLTGFFPFLKNRTLTSSASMQREVN